MWLAWLLLIAAASSKIAITLRSAFSLSSSLFWSANVSKCTETSWESLWASVAAPKRCFSALSDYLMLALFWFSWSSSRTSLRRQMFSFSTSSHSPDIRSSYWCCWAHLFNVEMPTSKSDESWGRVNPLVVATRTASRRNLAVYFKDQAYVQRPFGIRCGWTVSNFGRCRKMLAQTYWKNNAISKTKG